jgi:hypothetical protein
MADDSRILITPEFRMSYPQLITPKKFQNKGEPTYNLEMIFDPEDLAKFKLLDETPADPANPFIDVDVQQMILQVIKGKWGDINVKQEFATSWPVKSGDTISAKRKGKGAEALLGKKVIKCKASAEYPPRLYYTDDDGERKEIYHAFAEVTAKALDTAQGKFVTFYLNSIKMTRRDEKFGGGSIFDKFDQSGVTGGESNVNPLTEDDIPF